jgi:hypothetical protein
MDPTQLAIDRNLPGIRTLTLVDHLRAHRFESALDRVPRE